MKKTKILLSFAMMCLSVAVLCIGILAVNSATYDITGYMSYNKIDGVALVNTRVYKVSGDAHTTTELETTCNTFSTKSFEEIERISSPYYIQTQKLDSKPLINTKNGETTATSTTKVNITYGAIDSGVDYYTYYVVIEIKNVSTDYNYTMYTYIDKILESNISNVFGTSQTENNKVEINRGKYVNIVLGFSYKGTTTTAETVTYTLNIDYSQKYNLKLENSGTYWYTELGTLSDGTTPIRWRLVYDGIRKYEYSETNPVISPSAIFVQETYTTTMVFTDDKYYETPYSSSSLRTHVNKLSNFGLETTPEYVDARNGNTFQPLTKAQIESYFSSNNDRVWKPYNYESGETTLEWWSSSYYYKTWAVGDPSYYPYYVNGSGELGYTSSSLYTCGVRAAFQLV